jgi:quinol monooxygenase YgiN
MGTMKLIEAIVTVKPDKVELYEKTFHELQTLVYEKEPGTPYFELCKDIEKPFVYHVFDCYVDDTARATHASTDHYMAGARIFVQCLAGDHMAEAAKRGLTDPRDIYPLANSLKVLVYDTL